MTNKCEHGYFKESWRSCPQCRVTRFRDAEEKLVERDIEIARLRAEVERLTAENKAAWDSAEYNANRARKAEAEIKVLQMRGGRESAATATRLWSADPHEM